MTLSKILLTTMASAAALALPLGAATAQTEAGAGLSGQVQSTVDTATDTANSAAAQTDTQSSASASDTNVVAVTEADVKAGDAVHDTTGAGVGTVEAVSASGAVIATGKSRIQVPLTSLGKNDKGLVIAMSKAELDAAAEASKPK